MNVRGERECRDCGSRWSYYETGTVACPACGSLRSVGVEERATHTDAPVSLNLSTHRARFGEARETVPTEGADDLKRDLREYLRKRGFIKGGELRPLDGTVLAPRELLEAVDVYERRRDPADADGEYVLALLAGADDGERPSSTAVPESMRAARGSAVAWVVSEYRGDLLTFLDELESSAGDESDESRTVSASGENPKARAGVARAVLERLRDRIKHVEALEGDVDPSLADSLIEVANGVGEYVRTGDTDAIDRARSRLDEIES
ncbi:MAG: hypothetical protein PPP55_07400 [Halorubrum sp.]